MSDANQTPQANDGWNPPTGSIAINPDTATNQKISVDPDGWNLPTMSADPKQWTPEQLERKKEQTHIPGVQYTPVSQMTGDEGLAGVATGFEKSAAGAITGASRLVNEGINKVLPASTQLPLAPTVPEPKGIAENIGGMTSQAAQYELGSAEAEALGKLTNVAKNAPELFQLIKEHPVASKILLGMFKGAGVGGAQGAVQAAGSGKDVKAGAEGGAVGGGAGGAVAEAAPEVLPKIAKLLGVGGESFESAMSKAGRPGVAEINWKKSLETAKPLLLDQIDASKVKSIDDFVEQVGNIKDDLWKNEIQPQIDSHVNEPVTTTPIAAQIRAGITRSMRKHFPEEAAAMEQTANNFIGTQTIGELNEDLQTFNAKLQNYYKMNPAAMAAIGKTDGDVAGLERAADGMRDLLYKELERHGEDVPAQLRTQYGALKDVERVFTKRIPVADRQQGMNLAQILSLAGGIGEAATALATGHPEAAVAGMTPLAAATVVKARQAAPSMIRQGLKAGVRETVTPGVVKQAAGQIAKTVVGSGSEQTGAAASDGWVRMMHPMGQHVEVHPDDVPEAEKRGMTQVPVEGQ